MEERNKFPSVFLHMLKALYKKDKRAFPHSFYEIKIRSLQPENWFPTIHKSLYMPTVYCIFGTSLISSVVWLLFAEEEIHRVDSHYSLFKVINVDCYLPDYYCGVSLIREFHANSSQVFSGVQFISCIFQSVFSGVFVNNCYTQVCRDHFYHRYLVIY